MPDTLALRIDKLLWYLRLAKSRTFAQNWIAAGHMRVNGNRVLHDHLLIHVGDVLTLPLGEKIVTLRINQIPTRRGPASEAQNCYSFLTADKAQ
jgi:ribosome-associated heat shock protein Hsp15